MLDFINCLGDINSVSFPAQPQSSFDQEAFPQGGEIVLYVAQSDQIP